MTEVFGLDVILVICVIGGWQTFEGCVLGTPAKDALKKLVRIFVICQLD